MSDVHSAAVGGYSQQAKSYSSGRPDYPAELHDWLVDVLGATAGKLVVDLGAGTGKFTKRVVATGADVIAIEPVAAMREQARLTVPGIKVLDGSAESTGLDTASVDVIVCAQAFHWFATDAALREMHRVLRPGGRLGLIWNVRDESTPWVAKITDLITPFEGDVPRFHTGKWRNAIQGSRWFDLPAPTVLEHAHVGPSESVIVDRFRSTSFIADLPEADREALLQSIRDLVASEPTLRGRESVSFPYRTEAYCCRRLTA
ncbi:class I SAM-dependent methyltransferase [soil metagenome]